MKKALILISAMGFVLSCNKALSPKPSVGLTPKISKPRNLYARDGKYDVLGFGYDATQDYAVSSSTLAPVLNITKFIADYPNRLVLDLSHTSAPQLFCGYSSENYLQTRMSAIGVGVNSGGTGTGLASNIFSGSLNAAFHDTLSSSSKYVFSGFDIYIQRKHFTINAPISLLQSYLDSTFVQDVNTQSPAYIVSHYGTHVLINIMLGGTLNITYRSETNNESRYSASAIGIKASVGKIFNVKVNDSTSTATSDVQKNFDQSLSAVTHGGDPSQAIITTIPLDGSQATPISITAWQNSVTDDNSEFVNIGQNGLIQISDLITDPVKKAALETYINQYLAAAQIHLLPTPLYEFYSSKLNKHYYSTDPNNYQLYPGSGYAPNGQPFKVYASPLAAGTVVPVYQFYNALSNDHVLTTNRNPGWQNYNYDGVVCYGNTSQVGGGSIPVYEFFLAQGDHVYSANRNAYNPPYMYNSQPWFAYHN